MTFLRRSPLLCNIPLIVSMTFLCAAPAAAQAPAPQPKDKEKPPDVKALYTKYECRIPMRDGKRLFTSVYVPKDQSQSYPMLFTRTPYRGSRRR